MLIIRKDPGAPAYIDTVENSLKAMQEIVGGHIETVTIALDVVLICNEDGRLLNLPYNCTVLGVDFYGPIFAAGYSGEEFCSLPAASVLGLSKSLR